MTHNDKGEGVQEGPRKNYVIHEQPLAAGTTMPGHNMSESVSYMTGMMIDDPAVWIAVFQKLKCTVNYALFFPGNICPNKCQNFLTVFVWKLLNKLAYNWELNSSY